jgi:hypothetical protein
MIKEKSFEIVLDDDASNFFSNTQTDFHEVLDEGSVEQ